MSDNSSTPLVYLNESMCNTIRQPSDLHTVKCHESMCNTIRQPSDLHTVKCHESMCNTIRQPSDLHTVKCQPPSYQLPSAYPVNGRPPDPLQGQTIVAPHPIHSSSLSKSQKDPTLSIKKKVYIKKILSDGKLNSGKTLAVNRNITVAKRSNGSVIVNPLMNISGINVALPGTANVHHKTNGLAVSLNETAANDLPTFMHGISGVLGKPSQLNCLVGQTDFHLDCCKSVRVCHSEDSSLNSIFMSKMSSKPTVSHSNFRPDLMDESSVEYLGSSTPNKLASTVHKHPNQLKSDKNYENKSVKRKRSSTISVKHSKSNLIQVSKVVLANPVNGIRILPSVGDTLVSNNTRPKISVKKQILPTQSMNTHRLASNKGVLVNNKITATQRPVCIETNISPLLEDSTNTSTMVRTSFSEQSPATHCNEYKNVITVGNGGCNHKNLCFVNECSGTNINNLNFGINSVGITSDTINCFDFSTHPTEKHFEEIDYEEPLLIVSASVAQSIVKDLPKVQASFPAAKQLSHQPKISVRTDIMSSPVKHKQMKLNKQQIMPTIIKNNKRQSPQEGSNSYSNPNIKSKRQKIPEITTEHLLATLPSPSGNEVVRLSVVPRQRRPISNTNVASVLLPETSQQLLNAKQWVAHKETFRISITTGVAFIKHPTPVTLPTFGQLNFKC